MENFKYLLVIGGTGVLGSAIVKVFKNNSSNWKICVIDYVENPQADKNITIDRNMKYTEENVNKIYSQIEEFSKVLHSIFNMAEGLVKGTVKSIDIFLQTDEMLFKNYYSCLFGIIKSIIFSCSFSN